MSEKTVNQEANNPTGGTSPEKTFTQSQLDAIVADRLKREREKYPDYDDLKAKAARLDELEAANKSELEKAQQLLEEQGYIEGRIQRFLIVAQKKKDA